MVYRENTRVKVILIQNGKETIWGEAFVSGSERIQEVVNGNQMSVLKYTIKGATQQVSTELGVLPLYFNKASSKANGWKVQCVNGRSHRLYGWC
jgi:hypothetical protein